jgi:hypothetical protein
MHFQHSGKLAEGGDAGRLECLGAHYCLDVDVCSVGELLLSEEPLQP